MLYNFQWKVVLPVQQLQLEKLSVGNATNHIFMSWRLYILLHFLASHALKACLFKVWESKSRISVNCHKVPECKQLHLNHCQLQIIMENVFLYQSNWHTFVYISVRGLKTAVDGTPHPVKVNVHQKNTFHLYCPVWVKAKNMQHSETVAWTAECKEI